MNRNLFCVAAAGVLAVSLLAPSEASATDALRSYVEAPDDSFSFERKKTLPLPGSQAHVLELVSQTWQGKPWVHKLVVVVPDKIRVSGVCLLLITGGSNRKIDFETLPGEAHLVAIAAGAAGTPVAVLQQVPNQPLFGDLYEDDAIAYTFQKFMENEDPTWPLLLPMTKSAVRAMDAVQAFLEAERKRKIERFVVTGGSKRGWTTWLTGAVDGRVQAIAPMVIDVLNIPRQMKHQLDAWGAYSPSISEYTKLGLQEKLAGPEARSLLEAVDPYAHRERLTMPKLVILGTNDDYWPVDAARFYFFDLPGPKYLHYVPNVGHGLDLSVVNTLTGFYQDVIAGRTMPRLSWSFETGEVEAVLTLKSYAPGASVEIFRAVSDDRDFRDETWTSQASEMEEEGVWVHREPLPGQGYVAFYGALDHESVGGKRYHLCTHVGVFPALEDARDEGR